MNYNSTEEFNKDYKRLLKKFRTLTKDLDLFIDVLKKCPLGNSRHFAILTKQGTCVIVKARLFCGSLKGKSLRIIYAYNSTKNELELMAIEFIELYFKGDKEREDEERIKVYLKNKKSPK